MDNTWLPVVVGVQLKVTVVDSPALSPGVLFLLWVLLSYSSLQGTGIAISNVSYCSRYSIGGAC